MLVIYFPFSQKQINTFCISSNLLKKIQNTFDVCFVLEILFKVLFSSSARPTAMV